MAENNSIQTSAYFNLLKTGSWIEERIKEILKPFELTHAQMNALYILMENDPSPLSASELKNEILVSNPDVTRLLDRLVKKGYVIREACPENRRKIDISLTGSGRELFREADGAARQAVGNFFEDKITVKEATELRKILRKIRE